MDKRTAKALEASIKKWKRNVKAPTPQEYLVGPDDCPLCKLFFDFSGDDYGDEDDFAWIGCKGCPIAERTGMVLCDGTPYEDATIQRSLWITALDLGNEVTAKAARRRARKAARAEVAFLESLREKADESQAPPVE